MRILKEIFLKLTNSILFFLVIKNIKTYPYKITIDQRFLS